MDNKLKFMLSNSPFWFSEEFYSALYSISQKDSYAHFSHEGIKKGFNPNPLINLNYIKLNYDIELKTVEAINAILSKVSQMSFSDHFSSSEYYELNPDVKIANIPALSHFFLHGRKEKRPFNQNKSINYRYILSKLSQRSFSNNKIINLSDVSLNDFNDEWDSSYNINYFKEFNFKTLKPKSLKNISIIGELSLVQCKKYRIFQKMQYFQKYDIQTKLSSWHDHPRCMEILQFSDLLILYRVPSTKVVRSIIKEAKRLGLQIIYDIDDPIFHLETYVNSKNLQYLEEQTRNQILSSISAYEEIFSFVDSFIVSTPKLKTLIESKSDKKVNLWRNLVDSETINALKYNNLTSIENTTDEKNYNIIYVSGSKAHEADFRHVMDQLIKFMYTNTDVHFHIVGHAENCDELINLFPDRVFIERFKDYYSYIQSFKDMDLSIIPLLQDSFNDCKSAIRYYEASLMKIPTLVSEIGDFKNIIENERNGYLVSKPDQWFDLLNALKKNKSRLKEVANNAYDTIMESYILDNQDDSLLNQIKQLN